MPCCCRITIGLCTMLMTLSSQAEQGLLATGTIDLGDNFQAYSYNSDIEGPFSGSNESAPTGVPDPDAVLPLVLTPDTTGFNTSAGSPVNIPYLAPNGYLVTYKLYTIGTEGTKSEYDLGDIQLYGKVMYYFVGDVTLVVDSFSISGQAYVILDQDSKLTIYSNGNVTLAAQGITNKAEDPKCLIIYGTDQTPGEQIINISGNVEYFASVYAPYASVNHSGYGNFAGAIVCRDYTFSGSGYYSYDTSLEEVFPFGTPADWNPTKGLRVSQQLVDTSKKATLTWESEYAATYQIEYAETLAQSFAIISGAILSGTGDTMTWTDDTQTNMPSGYYRISIVTAD